MVTGKRIKEARKATGMTQADLAKKLGIPFQSVSQWERGTRSPKYETLRRIADALGVSWLDLAGVEYTDDLENDFSRGWEDWLHSNNIFFQPYTLGDHEGIIIHTPSTKEAYFLTADQAKKLPDDSIKLVWNLISEIGHKNKLSHIADMEKENTQPSQLKAGKKEE